MRSAAKRGKRVQFRNSFGRPDDPFSTLLAGRLSPFAFWFEDDPLGGCVRYPTELECERMLKLAERYSSQRLESACQKALSYTSSPSLKSIQSILKSGQDKLLAEDAPAKLEEPKAHKFTRGAGYYKRGE